MSNLGPIIAQQELKLSLRSKIRKFCSRLPARKMAYFLQRFGLSVILLVLLGMKLTSSGRVKQFSNDAYEFDEHYQDEGLRFRSSNSESLVNDHKDLSSPVVPPPPPQIYNYPAPLDTHPAPVASPSHASTLDNSAPPVASPYASLQEPKEEGLHFISSHPTKPPQSMHDNWQEDMDRPVFQKNQDRYFSFNVHEDHIEGMATRLPETLENYKNPCWYEEVPNKFTYNTSFFYRYYRAGFGQLPHGDWVTTFKNMENRIQYRKKQSRDGKGWRLRCYPYYFVLGFTKAGTTDYCHQLHQFPTLFSGIKKEPQYWNKIRSVPTLFPTDHRPVRPSLSDYLDLYDAAAEGLRHKTTVDHGHPFHTGIVGDCDPQTVWQLFGWEAMAGNDDTTQPTYKTPSHLYALNPKTKFIILLRDPVERAFSHYRFFQGGAKDARTQIKEFHDNVNRTISLLTECTKSKTTKQCIHDRTLVPKAIHTSVTVGLYSTHLREWLNVFPREQFLFLKSEDYFESRAQAIKESVDFLGLDLEGRDLSSMEDLTVINAITGAKTEMKHETKQLLRKFFRPYNADLANLLQEDSLTWDY